VISAPSSHSLQIGEIAKQSGLPVKTIRYYEDIGLLGSTAERSPSGYRLFHPGVLNRLAFIKRAQSLGLSLAEIADLLAVHDQGQLPCEEVKEHLEMKLMAIAAQIEALETLQSELTGILSAWQEQPPAHRIAQTICPNLQPPGLET
jgi:MerR family transcriptional regulator, copper efflux regulator